MQYLALLYGEETDASQPGSPEWDAEIELYERFDAVAGDAIVGGEALAPSATAATIRFRDDGPPLVTDGPYTEATEVVGGLFVLEAEDLEAAMDLARHIPAASDGAVELRPLVQWFQQDTDGSAEPGSTRYLAVLAGPENEASDPENPAWDAAVEAHRRFGERAGAAVVGGGALHPAASATTVRVRDGNVLVTDGPFTEATEVVGGLYVLRTATRDEAVELAKHIPMGADGTIELRPIVELSEDTSAVAG